MDLPGLERLGKVAGISGISVGAVVLLLNGLIGTIPGLPADQQAGIVRLLAILSFGIGAVGILAWFASGRSANRKISTAGIRSPGIIAEGDVHIGDGCASPERPVAPRPRKKTDSPRGGEVHTRGDESPAVVSGGNVTVRQAVGITTASRRKKNR